MNKFSGILLFLFLCLSPVVAATGSYRFRVYLKDKGEAGYRLDRPEAYLSEEAVKRRIRRRIPLTESDLPIAPAYLDTLAAAGVQPVVKSKWLATVVVDSPDSLVAERLEQLSIVDSVKWVWKGESIEPAPVVHIPTLATATAGENSKNRKNSENVKDRGNSENAGSDESRENGNVALAGLTAFILSAEVQPPACVQSAVAIETAASAPASTSTAASGGNQTARLVPADSPLKATYGYAEKQIQMLNGIRLHKAGFRGEGMRVAVIDAGFECVDRISAFDSLKLLGTHNVVFPGASVFEGDDHGTKVLSCVAANAPGIMVGTAPEASYWLIKSEDSRSEFPIEEDYWTAALEFADSVGVDVVTSSLGYFIFDREALSHTPGELDGRTAHISRAARMAASKGLLLFSSAGNEGSGTWEKITFPADVAEIVTVGSVNEEKKKSSFSSTGFTADGRVKPDVVALGTGCCVIDPSGSIRYANGTSFSTPIVAGLGICLWQAFPYLSNQEIIERLRQSGSRRKRPDAELGYGLPDFYKIYKQERKHGQLSR